MNDRLFSRIGYTFLNSEKLGQALTHRSFYFEHKEKCSGHNERLEFLGDAVLDLILSQILMQKYPDEDEGTLSKWRASLVNETSLATLATELELGAYLYLGRSENLQRMNLRPRLLASALEALIAAIYLDGGLEKCRACVESWFGDRLNTLDNRIQFQSDFKTRFQEHVQKSKKTVPEYRLIETTGPEHAKVFVYEVLVEGIRWGMGQGSSRKSAEQSAAQDAFQKIEELIEEEQKIKLMEKDL